MQMTPAKKQNAFFDLLIQKDLSQQPIAILTVILNLVQDLTASLTYPSARTDAEICNYARAETSLFELYRA